MNKRRPWSAQDIATLRYNYTAMGAAWCANKLGRSLASVENKANRIGISSPKFGSAVPLGPARISTTRRCTDCKRPTTDFRCPACWEKRRAKYRDSCDGPTADEMYGVMA